MIDTSELSAMCFVLSMVVGLMTALRAYKRLRGPHPEVVRKLFHVGAGLCMLLLPYLFGRSLPVLVLAACTILGFVALRRFAALRKRLGGVIDGVERESLGEIYFAFGVGLVFWLADGDALMFAVPVLVLTLADAVAALVGIRYGRARFRVLDGYKSLEGSTAFLALAFVSIYVPTLVWGAIGAAESFLMAATIAMTVTIAEAFAPRGLDNLVVPVLTFVLLEACGPMPVEQLAFRLAAVATPLTVAVLQLAPKPWLGDRLEGRVWWLRHAASMAIGSLVCLAALGVS
jgi:phytol kinase